MAQSSEDYTHRCEPFPRNAAMRKRVLKAQYKICVERARYVTAAYRETEGQHPSWRAARAFDATVRNMSLFILPEEQVVGNYCSDIVGTLLPVERGDMNIVLQMDLDNLLTRKERPYRITPEDREELMGEILPYWKGRTLRDIKRRLFKRDGLIIKTGHGPREIVELVRSFGADRLKKSLEQFFRSNLKYLARAREELPINNPNLVNNVFDVQGHLVIGHNNIIRTGFKGVYEKAAEKLKSPLPEEKKIFLESVLHCCEAARAFSERFAALASDMATEESDPGRRAELLTIKKHAERVPWLPPRNFHEAAQFFWFSQVLSCISYGMTGICAVGRVDQYLYPFFKKSAAKNDFDNDSALELVEELLIKLSNNLIMLPEFGKATGSELGADSMAPTIGGVDINGNDATNDLSYIFLDAIKNLSAMSNSYSVRLHPETPQKFLLKLADVHAATSGIAIFNDSSIIPTLQNCGYTLKDARDYAIIGCVEPTSQGNTFGCTSGNDVSMVGALEMALNRGKIRMVGRRAGPDTNDPRMFESFSDLFDAYRRQLRFSVNLIAACVNAKDEAYYHNLHNPYISSTIDGCIDNAEDMACGGARYNFASIGGRGLATAADSLCTIKKFVYEDRRYSINRMMSALETNFRNREPMRRYLYNRTPRYGTDNIVADEMAAKIAEIFCEEVTKHRSFRKNSLFRPGFFSYGMHILEGSLLGATPDGRSAGHPVSNSLSPVTGIETGGPTATLCSASRINHSLITNGSSLNMKLMPNLFRTETGRKKFISMVQAYFEMGGAHVQFNVVDDKTLRRAQKYPDEYRDLIVRVSGYVAYFTDLGRPLQDELIARTQFNCL